MSVKAVDVGPDISVDAAGARPRYARPELLAPAGDWECARAAVENGADAIYFGLERFNARMRAHNFTVSDLPELMAFLHRRGVRGYATFNTLVFTEELAEAEEYLRAIIAAGVDAAIVQDVGVCRLIRRLSPDFPIHASTQMTVTSDAGVEFARDLGAGLVVLARENSLREIVQIQAAQRAAEAAGRGAPLPLEVFVHGALCVAYSGQCLTSEVLGGRSANRGECAQACRLPYGLVSDGQPVDLGDRAYLLSPQDLAGLDVLPDLVRAGVASLKIEGRLKSPEYVASITRTYRQALDRVMAELNGAEGEELPPFDRAAADYELNMAFSRGLYTGWFRGINNQELAHGRFGTKRGVFLGRVTRVGGDHVALRAVAPLKAGDGVVFDAGNPAAGEEGGRIYSIDTDVRTGEAVLRFGRGDVDFRKIRVGDRVWKTSDPALERELRATFVDGKIRYTRPVWAEVHGRVGEPLTLLLDDREGRVVRASSTLPLVVAEKQALDEARLREQIGRLGGTPFRLEVLENRLEGALMLPLAELNRVRREAVAKLERLRAEPRRWTLAAASAVGGGGGMTNTECRMSNEAVGEAKTKMPPRMIVLVRDLIQLEAVLGSGVEFADLYCEFENPKHHREAVVRFRAWQKTEAGAGSSAAIWVLPPRVFKSGEEWILKQVLSAEADGVVVRNHEHLRFFPAQAPGLRRRGDFSLNVANPLTAEYFLEHYRLERVTASYDLNVAQLESLLRAARAECLELTLHQHMPMFHMEHCVFCAFLSNGKDYRDCGRPCEKHRVALRDRTGALLPLKADAGCRNTVFNPKAQTGAEFFDRLVALGARWFRVEFVDEAAEEVVSTLRVYADLFAGRTDGATLWRELKLVSQMGVTRGQLEAAPRMTFRKR